MYQLSPWWYLRIRWRAWSHIYRLHRCFASFTEWLELPADVVVQLKGYKPFVKADKHYTVRPLDLLPVHHEKIEAWILEQAGVTFIPSVE